MLVNPSTSPSLLCNETKAFVERVVDLSEKLSLDKSKEVKKIKNSLTGFSAQTLLDVSNLFGVDAVDFFMHNYCEKALIDKFEGKSFYVKQKYLEKAESSTKSLRSLINLVQSKEVADYILGRLQISRQFVEHDNKISVYAIKDASNIAKPYINNELIWELGEQNCLAFSDIIQSQDFSHIENTKKYYEAFFEDTGIIEKNFSYKIIDINNRRILVESEQIDQSKGELSYTNDYTNICRASFIQKISSLIPGDSQRSLVKFKQAGNKTLFEIDILRKGWKIIQ